jgi:hypothetical protein
MKRVTTTLCTAAALACTVTLGAQSTQSGQRDQTPQPRGGAQTASPQTAPQARGTSTVSYIGCVAASGPNAWALTISEMPGTAGTASGSAGTTTGATQNRGNTQDSTRAEGSGQAQANRGSQTTGTTGGATAGATAGTTSAGTTASVGQRVQLIGSGRTNLSQHVGQKVEVTGTMVPQGAAQGRTTGQAAAAMQLNVDTVRMISATCDAGTSSPQTQPRNQGSGSTTQPGSTPGAGGTSGTTESGTTPEQRPR